MPQEAVLRLVDKLAMQKGIIVDYENVEGAGHVYGPQLDMMLGRCEVYLDRRMSQDAVFNQPDEDEVEESIDAAE